MIEAYFNALVYWWGELAAWKFINKNDKRYVKVNGMLIEIEAVYDRPEPVFCRKLRMWRNEAAFTSG